MKINKRDILMFILGGILFTTITAFAITKYNASDISFESTKTDKTNLRDAIDELYSKNPLLTNKVTDLTYKNLILNNNEEKTLYAAIISYTGNNINYEDILNARTTMKNVSGATAEELFYSNNISDRYAFRLYKLTNCDSTITLSTNIDKDNYGGQIILFK